MLKINAETRKCMIKIFIGGGGGGARVVDGEGVAVKDAKMLDGGWGSLREISKNILKRGMVRQKLFVGGGVF